MTAQQLETRPEVVVLAAASSQTDTSATRALNAFGFGESILEPLAAFGFITRSANEWQIERGLRGRVLAAVPSHAALWREANLHYLQYAGSSAKGVPAYLASGPGFAYHSTEVDPETGVRNYSEVAEIESLAANLQGLTLATEQQTRGLIESNSPDLRFLRAMTYYRSHRQQEAIELLRELVHLDDGSRDVAIAQHLVAHWDCQNGTEQDARASRLLFRRSLRNSMGREDAWHQAQVKHSLALCIAKWRPKDRRQAIELLESSLDLLAREEDTWGRAKVLHSLGQILTTPPIEYQRAMAALVESRNLGIGLGYQGHVSRVDDSVRLLQKNRPSESTRRRRARKAR